MFNTNDWINWVKTSQETNTEFKDFRNDYWKARNVNYTGQNKVDSSVHETIKKVMNNEDPVPPSPLQEAKIKKKKGKHDCATHVEHVAFGEGTCIHSNHAEPDENGRIAWYDVMFEHGVEHKVPSEELEVLMSEMHEDHNHEVDEEYGNSDVPLVKTGQGSYERNIMPADLIKQKLKQVRKLAKKAKPKTKTNIPKSL